MQVTVAPSTDQIDGSERFSGAGTNGSDLKRWKSWCLAKMNTMSSLKRGARGPFAHSMLDGDVLMAVEHSDLPEFAIEGCENVIFTILESRFSDIDSTGRTEAALFVSEMSQELTEKEEQDDESNLVLTEDEVREVLAPAWEDTTGNIGGKTASRIGKTIESSNSFCDADVPRRSTGNEVKNEVQPLWYGWTLGKRVS